jgi:hypothetical protein
VLFIAPDAMPYANVVEPVVVLKNVWIRFFEFRIASKTCSVANLRREKAMCEFCFMFIQNKVKDQG